MRQISLTIQYDGSNFSGLELQPGQKTIRGEIEKALLKIFKGRIKIITASRTDAGVHALAQVINFQTKSSISLEKIPDALNSCLPPGIVVIKAALTDRHARYDTKSKEYEYLIFNGKVLIPFYNKFVWQVKPKLNLAAMKKAAKILQGRHDFSSFCAAKSDDKNFVRTIYKISINKKKIRLWERSAVSVISFRIKGSGFLYKMVRNIVGTLVEVGLGKIKLAQVKKILLGKDRKLAGRTAPANGLCLIRVNY